MKKFLIAQSSVAAFAAAPALAADMATKAPLRAAPVAYAPSWTGCYIAGGGGYGWYQAQTRQVDPITGAGIFNQGDTGGKGWMGQGQAGCDYQFAGPLGNWVVGAFGDYTFSDVHGDHVGPSFTTTVGNLKEDWSWAVGGRLGYLVNPTFLTYFSGGYTETHFNQTNYNSFVNLAALGNPGTALPGSTYQGWFLGSGFEYNLSFLPGLYLKTEYRYSEFNRKQLNNFFTATGLPTGTAETVKPFTQSVITSLVYRFNWGGPVVAKY
jgi:outer membrane immunogenic protein